MASKRRTRAPAPLRSWRIDFIADNGKNYFMYVVAPSERAARTNARTAPVRVRLREIVRVVPHMTAPTFGEPVRGVRPRAEPPEPPPEPPPALSAEEEFDLRFSRDGERRRVERETTLFEDVSDSGLAFEHRDGDLFLRDTAEARSLVDAHGARVRSRASRDGLSWLEVPGAYDPWWKRQALRKRGF